jgi:hypothetical protein
MIRLLKGTGVPQVSCRACLDFVTISILTGNSRPERHGDAREEASVAGKKINCLYSCKTSRVLIGEVAELQVHHDARICKHCMSLCMARSVGY